MSIWAISDPHLSFGSGKPMDIFGNHWANHPELIREHWMASVKDEDTVLVPGDISWGMNFKEALPDLAFLDALPGKKLIGRGNHDYWWNSLSKLTDFCSENELHSLRFMRSNAFKIENVVIANTRGWILPDDREFTEKDLKIYRRELIRLRLSLEAAAKLRQENQHFLATFHYPPLGPQGRATEMTEMLSEFGVTACIYGHVHGKSPHYSFNGTLDGIRYKNTACDYLDFKPLLLYGTIEEGLSLPYFETKGYNETTLTYT